MIRVFLSLSAIALLLCGCAQTPLRGTGDLGVVVERASGSLQIIESDTRTSLARVEGLGDLSHASVVFSRDQRYAYVFGRDGGLSKVDLLTAKIDRRIIQGGNSIGGAISQDGTLIAVSNYEPGGVKVFDARTLAQVADIPSTPLSDGQKRSRVVGLVDAPTRPASASCSACSTPARSGPPISARASRRASSASRPSANNPMTR